MKKKIIRKSGFVILILAVFSISILSCQQQAPPPAQSPAQSGTVQSAPQAGSAQVPATGASTQMPATASNTQMPPGGSAQMPAPATPGITPSQDIGQILVGMTPEQVQQIMGPPVELYQKGFIEWKYPNTPQGKVDIRFQNNKVVLIEKYTKK